MKTTLITLAALVALVAIAHPALAMDAAKPKPYPKDVCIVSDNELGSMGRIITRNHEGQEVKFCCKPCVAKFEKDPKKYLVKIKPASKR